MNAWIKRLSPEAEFSIVILIAFGLPVISSLFPLAISAHRNSMPITNAWIYSLIFQEVITFGIIAVFIRLRGWRLQDFNLQFTWQLVGMGILLMIAAYLLHSFFYVISKLVWITIDNTLLEIRAVHVGLVPIALLSIINSFFEETLVVGYIVGTLQREQKARLGIGLSALIRALYHTYQGPFLTLSIMLIGLLFAYAYYRTSRLWPLIIAHALMDFLPLAVK